MKASQLKTSQEQLGRKKLYYLANRDLILQKRRQFVAENKERLYAKKKEYRKFNPLTEEQKEHQRISRNARYYRNRERILKQTADYHKAHPEIAKKSVANYCSKNRLKLREKSREYYRNNREKEIQRQLHRNHLRRAQINSTVVDLAGIKRWMSEVRSKPFSRCHWCGTKVSGRRIYFDHIIALSRGGSHTIGNLCATCCNCNQTKNARLISDWVVGGQTFLSL